MLNRRTLFIYASFVMLSLAVNYPGRTNADTLVMLWQAHNVGQLELLDFRLFALSSTLCWDRCSAIHLEDSYYSPWSCWRGRRKS